MVGTSAPPNDNGEICPLLTDDDTHIETNESESESWSEPIIKTKKPARKIRKTKTRHSISVRNNTLLKRELISNKRSGPKKARPKEKSETKSKEADKDKEIHKLLTAIGVLQEKMMQMYDEYKQEQSQLREELQVCKGEYKKLFEEFTSQKNCIDIILEEKKCNKSCKKNDAIHPKVIQTQQAFQGEIDSLKSDRCDFTQSITKKLTSFIKKPLKTIEKSQ